MEAILRREKLWSLVETKQSLVAFPFTIDNVAYATVESLNSEKHKARSGLILFVLDSLLGVVHSCRMYNAGDQ
jgi:hypothetical protein